MKAYVMAQASDGKPYKHKSDVKLVSVMVDGHKFDLMINHASVIGKTNEAQDVLSDRRTGWAIRHLNPYYLAFAAEGNDKPSVKQIAERVMKEAIEKNGIEKVLSVMASKPTINEEWNEL